MIIMTRRPLVKTLTALLFVMVAINGSVSAQDTPPSIEFNPQTYICYTTSDVLTIDGNLDEASWKEVPWTNYFLDIEGKSKPAPRFKTRAKMLWDETYFYIAAQMEEPHLWATLTQRDTVIFYDNDFEVFIDPDGDTHEYYELEVNALGTAWDLMLPQPYRDGGKAIDSWDIQGLEVGIGINGTLNNPADIDSGWTVELAIPWKVLEEAAPDGQKPSVGDQWRVNFSRVQWQHTIENGNYRKALDPETNRPLPEDNWVWSPQGIINMHYPEMWGYVQFAAANADNRETAFEWQNEEYIKWYLRRLYYRQHRHKMKEGSFATQIRELKADEAFEKSELQAYFPNLSLPEIHATQETFEIRMSDSDNGKAWYIREDGEVWSKALSIE